MQINKILPLVLLSVPLPALAGDDFGIWTELTAQKSLSKQFSVDGSFEFRAEDKLRQPQRWAVSLGGTYKPLRYLSIGVGYVYLHDYSFSESEEDYKKNKVDGEGNPMFNGYNVDHAYWRNRHRATFDVTGKLPIGRFTLALRERYQYTHYKATNTLRDRYRGELPEGMPPESWSGTLYPYEGRYFTELTTDVKRKRAKDRHYLRSRLQLEYNIKNCHWTPYASCELSNDFSESLALDKTRLTVGAEWKITKQHRLDFAYVYEMGADDDTDGDNHALSIGYKFKF